MVSDKPFIHLFQTRAGYYIYDVNTNMMLKVNQEVFKLLEDEQLNKINSSEIFRRKEYDSIKKLKEEGCLLSDKITEVVHPADEILTDILNNNINMIILQVTQQCNLRCRYCPYTADNYINRKHSSKKLNFEIAKKGIDFLMNHSRNLQKVNVGFYGGEPLLEPELIKSCVDYAKVKSEGKEVTYSITTNGTLLNENIVDFLQSYNVNLLISLDGPKEIHDENRRFASNDEGTFDKIMENVELIRAKYPLYYKNISFAAVLDPRNDFSCTNKFFTDYEGVKDLQIHTSNLNPMYRKDKIDAEEDFLIKTGYERFKIYLYKLGRLDKRFTSKVLLESFERLKVDIHDNREPSRSIKGRGHHSGPCIPGAQRLFVNVNGDFFPCERVSEASQVMKIGNVDNGFDIDRIRELLNIGRLTAKNCQNCWAFRYCHLCATSADDITALSAEKKLSYCEQVRSSIDNSFIEYCVLKEFGYNFDDNGNFFENLNIE
jgi:uncharacterized protein